MERSPGDKLRAALDEGAIRFTAADIPADEAALAAGGEGAFELEATAPAPVEPQIPAEGFEVTSVETVPPVSEEARDALRPPEVPHVGLHSYLEPGPDGVQMITGTPKS